MKNKETPFINEINNEIETSKVETVRDLFKDIMHIKNVLLDKTDIYQVRWKDYINKSWYRKLAIAFNISTKVISEKRIEKNNIIIYDFTVRAFLQSWRYSEASASCSSDEKDNTLSNNDIRAISQTRATNRAISDLIWISELYKTEIVKQEENKLVTNYPRTNDEMMTPKQRYLLTKLFESKYKDIEIREEEYKKLDSLTKNQARVTIKEFLDEWVTVD